MSKRYNATLLIKQLKLWCFILLYNVQPVVWCHLNNDSNKDSMTLEKMATSIAKGLFSMPLSQHPLNKLNSK
ncbi:hypothetical protein RN001_006647 [Aquatica leii]|uniref:Uncharacterized protein n=1 Tax=Aquatica leii TaxID=1421715 RepID=A0AAN7PEA8_9COLE|nr:hypothetical protein RN001_006647 [Aquatica leii]